MMMFFSSRVFLVVEGNDESFGDATVKDRCVKKRVLGFPLVVAFSWLAMMAKILAGARASAGGTRTYARHAPRPLPFGGLSTSGMRNSTGLNTRKGLRAALRDFCAARNAPGSPAAANIAAY